MLDGNLTDEEKYQKSEMHAHTAQLVQLAKGYRARRVPDDQVMNVLQAKLAYEVLMFLSRKQLCEAIRRHLSSRLPLDSDSSGIYLLAKPHLVDIDVAKLCLDTVCVTLNKAYSLRVVTPKSLLSLKRESDIAAEAIPVLRFDASSRESVHLCLGGRSGD